MAATNVLDYMARINAGARKVIFWQGKTNKEFTHWL